MANGVIVPSQARWKGVINLGGVEAEGAFEVFDSGGGWAFLFGKPLLRAFKAKHSFENDTVTVTGNDGASTTLGNGIMKRYANECPDDLGVSLTLDVKQRGQSPGGSPELDPPTREVAPFSPLNDEQNNCNLPPDTYPHEENEDTLFADIEALEESMRKAEPEREDERGNQVGGSNAPPSRGVHGKLTDIPSDDVADHDIIPVYANQPTNHPGDEDTILTRSTDPFKPERIARIVKEVTLGEDLAEQQRMQVQVVIMEFADCFALSMKEVNAIPGAVHRLNIPEGAKLQTKIPPRSYNPIQRAYLESKIDEMLDAGIIRRIHPRDVRFVAQMVLAQKAHEGQGLAIDELKHRVNDQCIAHNLPPEFELPPRPNNCEPTTPREPLPLKWRICQDFNGINKLTEIAPVPQGDTRAKQLRLSGHRYLHVFDFAAGFYGVQIHPDSQPYITFYVEGRGHFAYQQMPFAVTGGPSECYGGTLPRPHSSLDDGAFRG